MQPVAAIVPAAGLGRGGPRVQELDQWDAVGNRRILRPFDFYSKLLHGLEDVVLSLGRLLAIRGEALDPGGAARDERFDGIQVIGDEAGGDAAAIHADGILEPIEAVEARPVPAVVEPEGGHVVKRDAAEEPEGRAGEPAVAGAGKHVQEIAVIGRV